MQLRIGETMASATITVGRHSIALDEASALIARYTNGIEGRRKKSDFFAWPYYDRMDTASAASGLTDGDLLAPVLLNVNPGIHGFASLQRIRPRLVELLQEVLRG